MPRKRIKRPAVYVPYDHGEQNSLTSADHVRETLDDIRKMMDLLRKVGQVVRDNKDPKVFEDFMAKQFGGIGEMAYERYLDRDANLIRIQL